MASASGHAEGGRVMERLQVWFENQLVGHFDVDMGGYVGKDMIPILVDPLQDLSKPLKETRIPLKWRYFYVSSFNYAMLSEHELAEKLRNAQVSSLYEVERNLVSDEIVYRWTAAVFPDIETYERIFDLDLFIPAEVGGVDQEYRERLKKERSKISGWEPSKVWLDEAEELLSEKVDRSFMRSILGDAINSTTDIRGLRDLITTPSEPTFYLSESERKLDYRPSYELRPMPWKTLKLDPFGT
jgi:hypothetical protein